LLKRRKEKKLARLTARVAEREENKAERAEKKRAQGLNIKPIKRKISAR
jgi:hypothetical protein